MGNNHTRACRRYQNQNGKQYHLWMHSIKDADIIQRLDEQDNKQGYIKALIRADIAKEDSNVEQTAKS